MCALGWESIEDWLIESLEVRAGTHHQGRSYEETISRSHDWSHAAERRGGPATFWLPRKMTLLPLVSFPHTGGLHEICMGQ